MPGSKEGGARAAATMKKKYGEDFYKNIGKLGGAASSTGGFGSDKPGSDGLTGKERAALVGAPGGKKSRRRWTKEQREEHSKYMIEVHKQRKQDANV